MATVNLVTGDDISLIVTLKKNGTTFLIDPTSVITAALVDINHTEMYTQPIVQSNASPGADWANSKIVVNFAESDTLSMTYQGVAYLEIQVDDPTDSPGKTTFFAKVNIVSGLVP